MSFGILQPVAFVLLLLVPYVIWVARKSYADLTRTRAKVLVVVRTSIIVLLAVALAHVILSAKQSDIPVSAVFCVDVSDSISDETREQAEAFVAEALKSRSTDDRAGIVAFGSRAVLVAPAGTDTTPAAIDRAAGADDTDIAAAIRLAALSLPEDTEKRIVVLTDGNPTRGDAELAAAEARTLGVRIDTFALASGTGPDVAVAELNLPAFVRKSQPFEVHVKLASSARTRTVVKLYVDGAEKPTQQKEVVLIGGGSSVTFPVEIKEEGAKRVRVETETARDARASNNTAQALVMVGPRPKVLLVANSTADAVYLSSALEKQACAYRIFSPEDLHKAYTPKVSQTANPREWVRSMARAVRTDFDVVILANVPANDLNKREIDLINGLATTPRGPTKEEVLMLKKLPPFVKRLLSADERKHILRIAKLEVKDFKPEDVKVVTDVCTVLRRNVPDILKRSLTNEQMLALNRYVYDFGGGLVMVGGRNGFGSGGFYKTPLELALPVYSDPLKEAPVFAVVLILDKSWSMGDPQMGKVAKIDMAKETAIAAIERLTKKDHLAVISFDTEVHDILKMQRVEDIPAMVGEVSQRESFGLTNFYPALIKAQRILKTTVADYKHAVLLSDGRPSGPAKDYEGQLEKMRKDRVVVSTVAIGVDADKKLMNNIAAWGKGQYYFTEKIDALPEIILKEMGRLKEPLLVEGKFKPRPGPRPHAAFLKDVPLKTLPEVLGFNRSRAKQSAQVHLLVSAKDEPLLASWRYGAGTVVAFTSDAKNVWCPAWVAPAWQEGFARLWRQIVLGSLQQRRGDSDYRMTLEREPERTRVVLDVADRLGRFLPGQSFTARVSRVDSGDVAVAEPKAVFRSVGPGRYAADVKIPRESPVLVEVAGGEGQTVFTDGAVALASPEHLNVGTNEKLLETIRAATGGEVAKPEEVFKRTGAVTVKLRELDYLLLTLATVLFAVDVFVRRMPALMQVFRRRSA